MSEILIKAAEAEEGTASPSSSVSIDSTTNSENNGNDLNSKTVITINGNDRSKDLNEHDVVCEKGRGDHERWPGNKLYRHMINVHKESYNDLAPIERSNVIGQIINNIQEKGGWFVNHTDSSGNWTKLSEEKVRKKVSDDLRREVRRRREKRSHNSMFSAKLRAIKEMEEQETSVNDILEQVNDPRQTDVLFGPGARRHPGNKTYWHLMKTNLDQYIISPYGARSVISRNIVQGVRVLHGRFLEQDHQTGLWYSISDKRAIEKTSHALSNMKYKTRKRHPDEPAHYHHPGHIAYRVGPYDDFGYDDDDESEEEKSIDTDSPNTLFAKNRTKKFRLLHRMGDEDEEGTFDSKGSIKTAPSGVADSKITHQATSPVPGMSVGGKLISPNDSQAESREDSQEFQEQRNPNSFRQVNPGTPGGMPLQVDYAAYRVGGASADIAPRLSQYDSYLKNYAAGAGYKAMSYSGMRDDYAGSCCYGSMEYGPNSARGMAVATGAGRQAHPYGNGLDQARRRALKNAGGPGGYWVGGNEWAPEYY
ncbi:hypothetical protein IV203_033141 [Nitzschia inconspicua]|uniref:DUF6824 domain-containing protein n=1 Tax=Nitzschia inconspicua TaxID=303405 RepID=A0A9K3PFR2_9STRA|nr:hypothetical protein IV203_033141 [Nitzschia inconspicua]